MKATITGVSIDNGTITAVYSTGTVKRYPTDKIPGTVQAWIDSHNTAQVTASEQIPTDTEPADITTEQVKALDTAQTPAEDPEPITAAVIPASDPDITTEPVTESEPADLTRRNTDPAQLTPASDPRQIITEPARHQTASQAVMLGLCLSLAVVWFVVRNLAELAIIALYNVACHVWDNRQDIIQRSKAITAYAFRQIVTAAVTTATATRAATIQTAKTAAILIYTAGILASR